MKKYLIIIFALIIFCIAGNFTYKIKDADTLYLGKLSSPRAIISTTGVNIPGTLSVTGQVNISNFIYTFEKVTTTGTNDVVNPDIVISLVTTTNDTTVVLSNGSYSGQLKKIILAVDAGVMTLTPISIMSVTNLIFSNQFDSVELVYDANTTNWNIVNLNGVIRN